MQVGRRPPLDADDALLTGQPEEHPNARAREHFVGGVVEVGEVLVADQGSLGVRPNADS